MAYAFLLATELNVDIEKRYQLIEDVYAQADVFDKKYLQVRCTHLYFRLCKLKYNHSNWVLVGNV